MEPLVGAGRQQYAASSSKAKGKSLQQETTTSESNAHAEYSQPPTMHLPTPAPIPSQSTLLYPPLPTIYLPYASPVNNAAYGYTLPTPIHTNPNSPLNRDTSLYNAELHVSQPVLSQYQFPVPSVSYNGSPYPYLATGGSVETLPISDTGDKGCDDIYFNSEPYFGIATCSADEKLNVSRLDLPYRSPLEGSIEHCVSSSAWRLNENDAQTQLFSSSRYQKPRFPSGTSSGELQKDFKLRNHDYKKFFTSGRVFSTLIPEPYSPLVGEEKSSTAVYDSAFGQRVFSKIRRFVVVKRYDYFCTCLPIETVNQRSSGKCRVRLDEFREGLIYSHDKNKNIAGLRKKPLRVILSGHHGQQEDLPPRTYINYAKTQTVQLNWQVKDIGRLDEVSLKLLKVYFKEVVTSDCFDEPLDPTQQAAKEPIVKAKKREGQDKRTVKAVDSNKPRSLYLQELRQRTQSAPPELRISQLPEHLLSSDLSPTSDEILEARSDISDADLNPNMMDIIQDLGPGFTIITRPHRFFIPGRVFQTLWTEPLSQKQPNPNTKYHYRVSYAQYAISKIRRFVVIRSRSDFCLCLKLLTRVDQNSTFTRSARPADSAAVYAVSEKSPLTETSLTSSVGLEDGNTEILPFALIVEEKGEKIETLTRVSFTQVYTVPHDLRVKRVGRVAKEQVKRLSQCFLDSVLGR